MDKNVVWAEIPGPPCPRSPPPGLPQGLSGVPKPAERCNLSWGICPEHLLTKCLNHRGFLVGLCAEKDTNNVKNAHLILFSSSYIRKYSCLLHIIKSQLVWFSLGFRIKLSIVAYSEFKLCDSPRDAVELVVSWLCENGDCGPCTARPLWRGHRAPFRLGAREQRSRRRRGKLQTQASWVGDGPH